tara:strand:- start:381 stop:599 length:219 start_codon:yes stop_codon:yes gene_type:complete
MMTLTCIINQLDRSAGTKGAEDCKLSGKTKLAKPIESNEIGVATAETIGEFHALSAKSWVKVQHQVKKQSDS